MDPSHEFVAAAQARLGERAVIQVGYGEDLAFEDDSFDVVVSGLVLNFMPDPAAAVTEWGRVTRPGGSIAVYVWDYAQGMEFLRFFWDAVVDLDPSARGLDEAVRFPICRPDRLADLLEHARLTTVIPGVIEIDTVFADFDDYWAPFRSGQGPAPRYVAGLTASDQSRLEDQLRSALPQSANGTIALTAKAWTAIGTTR